MRKMKPSGVEWIGDICSSYKMYRLKHLLRSPLMYGANESGDPFDERLPRYIRITDITMDGVLKESGKLSLNEEAASGYILEDNDLLFARSGASVGKVFIYKKTYGRSAFAGYLIKASVNDLILPDYLFLYTQSSIYEEWKKQIFIQSTIQNIGADRYNNLIVVCPPLPEQQRIAEFLDRKCAEIDSVMSKTKATIEQYKALKQSVITQAVTKGIRPDRPMKDSGIEWIGEIPQEWKIRRIKTLFSLRDERNDKPLSDVNLISLYTDLGVVQRNDVECPTGNKASNADGYKLVYENDIVVNIILCWMGAIGRSDYNGVTSPAYDIYTPSAVANPYYYHYYFRTKGFSGDCYKRGKGIMAMRWRTYSDEFRDIRVVYPPVQEQQEIADYLDRKCAEIDRLIAAKEQLLTELESYKKSVIYEYVTGKKDV